MCGYAGFRIEFMIVSQFKIAYLYCYVACVNFVLTCSYYVLWTQYYGYYSPMPFTGYTAGLISGSSSYLALWFRYYPGSWI